MGTGEPPSGGRLGWGGSLRAPSTSWLREREASLVALSLVPSPLCYLLERDLGKLLNLWSLSFAVCKVRAK